MLFRFGLFALDPIHRHVSYEERPLQLPPKVFEVLLFLVRHSERIVAKEELREAVWPGVNVGEANLTQTVFLLRHKLQACSSDHYIATIPHRGYQFVMDVRREELSRVHDDSVREDARCPIDSRFTRSIYKLLSMRTSQSLSAAIRWCERAKRYDPANVSAYVNLANAYCLSMSMGGMAPAEVLPKVQAAVLAALELDTRSYAAFTPLGYLHCHFDYDWRRAELNFQQVIERCPGDLLAYHWYSEFLTAFQRVDEALAILRRAQEIDPASMLLRTDIAQTFYYAREYKDCEAQLLAALKYDPGYSRAYLMLGGAYARMGQYKKSFQALDRCIGEEVYATMLAVRADSFGAIRKVKDALKVRAQLQELSMKRYVSRYVLGFAEASAGETAQAFSLFDLASRENDHWLIWLKVSQILIHSAAIRAFNNYS
ncbi:MAG: hypothetical protein DMG65_19290 [Candidatus Angelobacter sp. Gp1-AA117]|nr:MAG: hypothetical protein DMG65_19290 [Candidatus Angelobacter sp. Gp1-AA117]